MRIGGIRKLASMGVSMDEFEKRAFVSIGGTLESAIKLSLYLGIPLGVTMYAVQSMFDNGKTNRKRKAALDQYNDIVNDYKLEQSGGFGGGGIGGVTQ